MNSLVPPPNSHPQSPRLAFQWASLAQAKGRILNVGCANDPAGFEDRCTHFDCDDWGAHYSALSDRLGKVVPFVQGDAHELGAHFGPDEFDTIIMGDIVEHLDDPYRAITQAAQLCKALCLTIWEEWRLPGFGKNIQAGKDDADKEAQKHGYVGFREHQMALHPTLVQYPEELLPHHCHIWQFSDAMVADLIHRVAAENEMAIACAAKVEECVHEGHQCYNWLVYLVKPE